MRLELYYYLCCRWQLLIGLVLELFGYSWDIGMIGNATKGIYSCPAFCYW